MARAWRRWAVSAGWLVVVACTDSFTPPTPYPAVQLTFTVQPSNGTAGVAVSPVIAVAIVDAFGSTVPSATTVVTLTLGANPGSAALQGTASVPAVAGVATFSTLHLDIAAAGYTLKAAATGLAGATSIPFTIAPAAATRLAFTVQPSNTMGGALITPPVQVAAQDSFGNRATGFADSVTVALGGNPAPGTLSGTTVVQGTNGVATFNDLSIASVSAGYTLTASAGGLAGIGSTPFAIAQPTGSLHITAVTQGSSPDLDGYTTCIDPVVDSLGTTTCGDQGSVSANATVTMTVDTGAHSIQLTGVAANCTVTSDNPQTVHVAPGQTATVQFVFACASGTLRVTTTTSGLSIPPYDYVVCVDPSYYGCEAYSPIGVDSTVTLSVALGPHIVELDGVAANCTVSGDNPRTVDAGVGTAVPFAITCVAAGAVHVTAATTGPDLPYGYSVCLDSSGTSCSMLAQVPANGSVTLLAATAGPHTVTVTAGTANCTISGSTTRAVTVPQDGTVDVSFAGNCVVAERIAFSSGGTIAVIRVDGSDYSHGFTVGGDPAWSPNGARLAYVCGSDICTINADSTAFTRLTVDAANNRHPTWSPDGSRIAFAATHAGIVALYVMAANGSGVTRLTQAGVLGSPAWSPDGATIVFDCRLEVGNDDLCSVHADGAGYARLTTDSAPDYGAAWKPDGSTLAFSTTRYGAAEIVLMSPAGGSVTRIGVGLPGSEPTWSLDGSQIAFAQVYENCDDYYGCYSYSTVSVANADGSGGPRYLASGDKPAWKPHQ